MGAGWTRMAVSVVANYFARNLESRYVVTCKIDQKSDSLPTTTVKNEKNKV